MFRRDQIFISYAREDVKWEEKFSANLHATLRHQTSFSVWSDERIRTGDDWRREISQALDRARVALLLVSTAFQNSRFIRDVEFPRLLKDAEDGGVTV